MFFSRHFQGQLAESRLNFLQLEKHAFNCPHFNMLFFRIIRTQFAAHYRPKWPFFKTWHMEYLCTQVLENLQQPFGDKFLQFICWPFPQGLIFCAPPNLGQEVLLEISRLVTVFFGLWANLKICICPMGVVSAKTHRLPCLSRLISPDKQQLIYTLLDLHKCQDKFSSWPPPFQWPKKPTSIAHLRTISQLCDFFYSKLLRFRPTSQNGLFEFENLIIVEGQLKAVYYHLWEADAGESQRLHTSGLEKHLPISKIFLIINSRRRLKTQAHSLFTKAAINQRLRCELFVGLFLSIWCITFS